MSGRSRGFFGAVLTIAGAAIGGPVGFALLIAGAAASYSGRKKLEQEALRRARASRDRQAVTLTVSGSFDPLLMVFGKTRVGGLKCVMGTENGPDMANQYVYIGVAHSACHAGGCEGIGDVWIDDTRIPAADIDGNGEVTAGVFAGLVKITHYRGTGTQAADATLTSLGLDYSTAYRRGAAWTLFRFKRPLDAEAFRKAFKFGEPNPSVELKGIRVYDPRLDSTNGGSGAHRYNDPTTWEWVNAGKEIGRNPILQDATRSIMGRLDGGEGIPPERIIWSTVAAAASKCEETGMYTDGSQWRFQSDGAFSSQEDPDVKMAMILDACQGKRIEVGSQFAYHAGSWATETFTIDDSWLTGDDFEYQVLSPIDSGYNAVRVNFADRGADYKTVEAPPYTNGAYEAEDGGYQNFKDLTLHMVANGQQAQYCSQIIGKRSRMQKVLALRCNAKALDVQPWETGIVNLAINGHSLSALRWRIAYWQPVGNSVDIVLEQDASAVYDVEAFQAQVSGDPPAVGAEVGPAPTNLTATAVSDGVHLKWDLPPEYLFTRMRIERSPDGVGSWTLAGTSGASPPSYPEPILDGSTNFWRVNGHNRSGTPSLYSNVASATAKQGADADSVRVSNAGFELGDAGWDKDSGAWTIIKYGSQRTGLWCGKLVGTGVSVTKRLKNTKMVPCNPGELVTVAGFMKSSAGANGTGEVQVEWLDSAQAVLSATPGNTLTPGATWRRSKVSASAPANTAYARIRYTVAGFSSAASEFWAADDSSLDVGIDTIDHIPDGPIHGRTRLTALTGGEVDLSKSGVINRVLTNIADDATYGKTKLTALTSGEVDLSKSGVLNKTADQISESGSRKWAAESGATVGANTGNLSLLAANLVNPVSQTGILNGWGVTLENGSGSPVRTSYDATENAIEYQSSGNDGLRSQTWRFDHDKIYRIAFRLKKDQAHGTWYVGIWESPTAANGAETNGSGGNFDQYNASRASLSSGHSASGNSYFVTAEAASTSYVDRVVYLVGANRSVDECPQHVGSGEAPYMKALTVADNVHVGLRFLNWSNSVLTSLFIKDVSVTELGAGFIDLATGMVVNKTVDNVGDGTTYQRTKATALTSGEVDLSKAGVLNRTADNITETGGRKWAAESGAQVVTGKDIGILADGATYGRTKLTALTSGEVDLSKAGVLNRSADNIAESGSRKWAGESGADVTAGKSIDVLDDVKTTEQFFTFTQTIMSGSGTVTIPTGSKLLVMRAWGGGGSGYKGVGAGDATGGGGGAGASKKTVQIRSSDHGQTISYSVGAGGPGHSTNDTGGTAGGVTTIDSTGLSFGTINIDCNGGGAGTNAVGGAGGTASGGDTNVTGSAGTFANPGNGAGGNSATIDSIFGLGGSAGNGSSPGGGGRGLAAAGTSGAGANGMVTFTWSG